VDSVRPNVDVETGGVPPRVNEDGNWMPPIYQAGFGPKTHGTMYRWSNGTITQAQEYTRTGDDWNDANGVPLAVHKCITMFYANIFDHFRIAEGDTTSYDMATSYFPYNRWYPLSFFNSDQFVSSVNISGDSQFLAGSAGNAESSLRQLALDPYANRDPDAPDTRGLSGSLALLIGLVAFTCRHRDLTRALINDRAWINCTWTGHTRHRVRTF
jgi:hypothetical protein